MGKEWRENGTQMGVLGSTQEQMINFLLSYRKGTNKLKAPSRVSRKQSNDEN